jgi:uncharacterized protein YlzI (FlbEa/FlbD family)
MDSYLHGKLKATILLEERKLIKFTEVENRKNIYVNTNTITYIESGVFGTELNFINGTSVVVLETEDEVVSKLYGQQLNPFTRTGDYSAL